MALERDEQEFIDYVEAGDGRAPEPLLVRAWDGLSAIGDDDSRAYARLHLLMQALDIFLRATPEPSASALLRTLSLRERGT